MKLVLLLALLYAGYKLVRFWWGLKVPVPPPVDPAYGDAEARRVLAVADPDERCRLALELLHGLREGSWDAREFYAEVFGRALSIESLDQAVSRAPDDADATLLRGRRQIQWAWEARGAGYANTVSDEGLRLFVQRLQAATKDLQTAARALPNDPTPYTFLLIISYGLSMSDEVAERWFSDAIERDSESFGAHLGMLTRLCARWQGSSEARYAFARKVVQRAGHGDLAAVLIAAHIEENIDSNTNTFKDPAARAEVDQVFDRMLQSPNYRARKGSHNAWNIAAYWYFKTEDKRRLRVCLERMGNQISEWPWQYEGDAKRLVERARKLAA